MTKRKNSSGYYDRFRARVMIPIADVFGHVVGFGGRIIGKEDEATPKYLNTPETIIFNKRQILFGLDKSGRAISSAGVAIVVEGYMDAISLFSAGVKNVVATLGTSFTAEHVKLILRYARKIIFCYDSDEAGQRATIRALPIVQAAGAEVFVVKVPDGKDPDEFIRKHGKAAFDELIQNAATLIDYRMNYVLAHAELSTIRGKIKALREILPVATRAETLAERNAYCQKIADALVIDVKTVKDELAKSAREERQNNREEKKFSAVKQKPPSSDESPKIREACEVILRMAWHESDVLSYALALIPREFFSPLNREIIAWLEKCASSNKLPDQMSAAKDLSDEANAQLSRILTSGGNDPRSTEMDIFNDSIKILRRLVLKKEYDELMKQIREYNSDDEETYAKIFQRSHKIKVELDSLKGN